MPVFALARSGLGNRHTERFKWPSKQAPESSTSAPRQQLLAGCRVVLCRSRGGRLQHTAGWAQPNLPPSAKERGPRLGSDTLLLQQATTSSLNDFFISPPISPYETEMMSPLEKKKNIGAIRNTRSKKSLANCVGSTQSEGDRNSTSTILPSTHAPSRPPRCHTPLAVGLLWDCG